MRVMNHIVGYHLQAAGVSSKGAKLSCLRADKCNKSSFALLSLFTIKDRYQAPTELISESCITELHFSYLLRSDSEARRSAGH